jgi:hypothetical protein
MPESGEYRYMFGDAELVPSKKPAVRFVAIDEKNIESPLGGITGSRLAALGASPSKPTVTWVAPLAVT